MDNARRSASSNSTSSHQQDDDDISYDCSGDESLLKENDHPVHGEPQHADDDQEGAKSAKTLTITDPPFPILSNGLEEMASLDARQSHPSEQHDKDSNCSDGYSCSDCNSQSDNSFLSSSCDDSDEEDDDDETRWSLMVRINSVVDLPTSILPSVPLCPLLKFGLLNISDKEQLQEMEHLSAVARRAEYERSKNEKTKDLPQTSLRVTNGILAEFRKDVSLMECSLQLEKDSNGQEVHSEQRDSQQQQDRPLSCKRSMVMCSSEKIMSKRDKGMMEWHEEMRWDDIKSPLQTVLAIELSARAVFPYTTSFENENPMTHVDVTHDSGHRMMMGKSGSHRRSKTSLDTERHANDSMSVDGGLGISSVSQVQSHFHVQSKDEDVGDGNHTVVERHGEISGNAKAAAAGGGGMGFLGLWRKGKQSLVERRNRKVTGSPTASHRHSSSFATSPKSYSPATTLMDGKVENIIKEEEEHVMIETTAERIVPEGTSTTPKKSPLEMTTTDGDLRLGTLIIPISNLPLEDEIPKVEKWFQFDTLGNLGGHENLKTSPWRSPTVLLDISLCTSTTMNRLEEEVYSVSNGREISSKNGIMGNVHDEKSRIHDMVPTGNLKPIEVAHNITKVQDSTVLQLEDASNKSSKQTATKLSEDRSTTNMQNGSDIKEKREDEEKIKQNGPYVEPGIIDYICVVGPRDVGDQKDDNGGKGWINSEPTCCVLEQFPPNEFHQENGRSCVLPEAIEWWCFPEGCKIWRGNEPPSHLDMNLKRFSASSPPRMASSIAAFDACLNCTSSFMWWVLSSNSDHYGSSIRKTYGAVIRFYAEIPSVYPVNSQNGCNTGTKLWCPLGICLTSSLPIVGILEAILLRLCEKLSAAMCGKSLEGAMSVIHHDVMDLILNYQRPVPGVINCSIPFLSGNGDRLHVALPPVGGLPPLPHGASVTSVCRLLGAEGLTALLAAVLTECKILMHSADVANLAMVGEVITALMYPFQWQLPFIPVLPLSMITFVEAPVSYFIGIPSCNMKYIQKNMPSDVFVIDLDNGFSSLDYFDARHGLDVSRSPTPLPASVSSNISKAIFRLLREEEELQGHFGVCTFSDNRHLTRLESESLAEREFRIILAHQLCGLMRGYQESLFYVSSCKPVFNRDRFLNEAPTLFEERRPSALAPSSTASISDPYYSNSKIVSPRSKRFLSGLINTQHFHYLIETLNSESSNFFHEVMETFESEQFDRNLSLTFGSAKHRASILRLKSHLEGSEQKVSTYHVHNMRCLENADEVFEQMNDFDENFFSSFTSKILVPDDSFHSNSKLSAKIDSAITSTNSHTSLADNDFIARPWAYKALFNIDLASKSRETVLWKKIHLREALGERKFQVWKVQQDAKTGKEDVDDDTAFDKSATNHSISTSLDLKKLISHLKVEEFSKGKNASKLNQIHTTNINILRRYIEEVYEKIDSMKNDVTEDSKVSDHIIHLDDDVISAMKDPSAQRFLISVLSQRSRLHNEYRHSENDITQKLGNHVEISTSNLHPFVFECLYNICVSMLEACQNDDNFELAYRLLVHSTGFCTVDRNMVVSHLTSRIARHQIYSDLRLWDRVCLIHQQDRLPDRKGHDVKMSNINKENDDYEATVSTLYEMLGYGMPADHLARFAHRMAMEKFYLSEKEQKLLTLARRLATKCEEVSSDYEIITNRIDDKRREGLREATTYWDELNWAHPSFSSHGYEDSTPITKVASIGSSIVATGALDGSLYLASTVHLEKEKRGEIGRQFVRGEQLTWSENIHQTHAGMGQDDFTNPGSISCLAFTGLSTQSSLSENHPENSLEHCSLIAGTTSGYLSVWNVSDALESALFGDLHYDVHKRSISEIRNHPGGIQSSHVRSNSSPSAYNKRKQSARTGRALGGHRNGVTCLSVPSNIYRPDTLVSGGNDGLIKMWSLRENTDVIRGKNRVVGGNRSSRTLFHSNTRVSENETLDVLSGHGGRILCIESAWNGDRLLSGATDRTVKIWDLSNQSGGQCLQTMRGHTGAITHSKYWDRNMIISASSDRSIALWDARSGTHPLFILRFHNAPVSDLYLESRTSHLLTSAASDGSICSWDCRMISSMERDTMKQRSTSAPYTVRCPLAQMCHTNCNAGPIRLGKGVHMEDVQSVMSVSADNVVKQWNTSNGNLLSEDNLRCGKVSCFKTFTAEDSLHYKATDDPTNRMCSDLKLGGTITATWDGAVKLRWLCTNHQEI